MAKQVQKKELGLGVRALLTNIEAQSHEKQAEVVRELTHTVAAIPLGEIEVNPFQPRKDFDPEALAELAESLKTHGLIQPITVRRLADRQYQLISGERRLRASKLAGLREVPAYIRLANDQEMIEMALVENIQREDLNAVEVAITFQRLIDECNLTHENLSDRVGKKRSTVTNFLRLLKLPPDIQKGLKSDNISMGHARALLGIDDFAMQHSIFKTIVADQLSVRETEDLIRRYNESRKPKTARSKLSTDYQNVQDTLRNYLGTKVALKVKPNGSGQIAIPFTSTAELNRLLDLVEK
ncbi:MAG: ParB/RepB/Spo0J family partition protein [Bacteroidetes bacterium]|nr:ParB/RepB/Spo0J family partition protein [Bacteroidota bacterium]